MNLSNIATPSALIIPAPLTRDGKPRQRAFTERRTYSPEVRAQALALIHEGKTQAAAARELGIVETTMNSWVRDARLSERPSQVEAKPVGFRAELLALRQSLQTRLSELERQRITLANTLASVREALDL